MPNTDPGVLLDERSEAEKAKDFHFEEIVTSADPVNWIEKPQNEWRKFPTFDQDGSGSCVAQTLKKLQGIHTWLQTGSFVHLSASHIYQRRQNRPKGGMSGVDAFKIAQKGVTLEQFAPSEKLNDVEMDAVKVTPFMEDVGQIFKLGNYVQLPTQDIDTVASVIQRTGKGVMVWFYFTRSEWSNVPQVKNTSLPLSGTSTLRHSVAAVDFTLYKGKKALIIDESWGIGTALDGQRVITEDFFKARNWFACYFTNFAFEEAPIVAPKPRYDRSIKSLQDCLKFEGFFPTNIESTGYFGSITKNAVIAFQKKYGINPPEGVVGPLTMNKLTNLYP